MDDQHQTAPESTRGLFDTPETIPFMPPHDKRLSFQGLNDRHSLPIQRRPRSRSSVSAESLAANNGYRRSYQVNTNNTFGLQSLPEEAGNGQQRHSAYNDKPMTVDNLQHMINTLKSMPAREEKTKSNTSSRRASSTLLMRPALIVQDEQDEHSREAALAEAEAKLMGTYKRPDQTVPTPTSSTKRQSLQPHQLPTLSENAVVDSISNPGSRRGSRRIQFNKPLNLDDAKKHHQHHRSASYSSMGQLGPGPEPLGTSASTSAASSSSWRSSAPPAHRHSASSTSSSLSVPTFNLVPFTPTRVNFSRDDANPHQRRQLFIPHLPFSALTPLFRSRQLVRGMLRVNKRNRSDAYVACEELDADIYVCGSRDRNRALEGDVVAIRLVDVQRVLSEKKEKEEAKLNRNGGQVKVRLPDEEDENEIIFGGDDDIETVRPKYCGMVVAILERAQNQVFSGTLTLRRPNNKRAQEDQQDNNNMKPTSDPPRIVWFKAVDKRVPLIAIPIEQVPADFVEQHEAYADRLFVSSIKRWPITSLHPFGTLEHELGQIVRLDVQTMAILADNNVTHTDFTEQVYKCLPSIPYEYTPIPSDHRRDFTKITCFTLDPVGSDVLDDALTIQRVGEDTFEVGVHISDVTYFIKANSPLDKEARARGVRVDLVHKAVPMLPEPLTQQVTNLVPGETRFAFSVVWKIDSDGKILDTWFGKSIVKSYARLDYEDAQQVLDGQGLDKTKVPQDDVREALEKDMHALYGIASQLHDRRFSSGGALGQQRQQLAFTFEGPIDNDHCIPTQVGTTKKTESAKLVKEFLMLANTSVAQKISSHMPELALLRRQARPLERKIQALQHYAQSSLGVTLDVTSANGLEQSIRAIDDPKLQKMISVLLLKTMQAPKYYCTGVLDIVKFAHYSLNLPLFTHFTAPSRRFADIIVHRQLEATLTNDRNFYLDRDTVHKLGQHCNVKKEAAIVAREQSAQLFTSMYLNKLASPRHVDDPDIRVLQQEALVIAVFDDYFDVMIPELNMERRIHLANLPVWRHELDSASRTLTMFWKKGVDTSTGKLAPCSMSDDDYEDFLDDLDDHPTATPQSPEPTKSSNKRQSIIQSRLSNSTSFSVEQSSQTIKALDKVRVILTIEMVRTPPLIRILAANPYA
ncbi:RNB-domain-containing protein [Hesseltinella vesiculosa]|uniref:RNB-domain-containing protein n=1 Tax=Hesseltinella vesiculosa TaxID=101127 RepID=A0A1X2GI20_9FUNG|nr:RNB-domain-containing protein [Hesseltinella vesiculosa]